jgi:hypothetical protein
MEPSDDRFDAIVAFTAFHWIDPETRYRKSAALLKPQGALAVIATQHVLPESGDRFWRDVQEDYDAVVPDEESTKAGAPGPPEAVKISAVRSRPAVSFAISRLVAISGLSRRQLMSTSLSWIRIRGIGVSSRPSASDSTTASTNGSSRDSTPRWRRLISRHSTSRRCQAAHKHRSRTRPLLKRTTIQELTRAALDQLSPGQIDSFKADLFAKLQPFTRGDEVHLPRRVMYAVGTKPASTT